MDHFRLRGAIGDTERTFPLRPGNNAIGRGASCQVRLPAKGVSHRHAELVVEPRGLRLKDLRSKNGTFVNGAAVMETAVAPGDRLWFGSTELVLEGVAAGELELAVDLGAVIPAAAPHPLAEDTPTCRRWLDSEQVRRWFSALEGLVHRPAEVPDLSAALARAAAVLRVPAAAVVELDGSAEGVLLASCGEPDENLARCLRSFFGETAPSAGVESPRVRVSTRAATPAQGRALRLTAAMLEEPGHRPLVLALQGEFPGRPECEVLLVSLVRLVRRLYPPEERRPLAFPPPGEPRLSFPPDYVPGVSAAIRRLHAQMEPLAQGNLPVLIAGETGTGKEHIARILHASSQPRNKPFVAINCAAVPAELLEPELFGIGKGVATGVSARPGRFLQAQGGTLFLDEVGDLPEVLQPKLLRALEERTVQPVGEAPISIDVRIIAATNANLRARVEDGSFRADLYYRLAGVELAIPPLRERRDDIPLLVEHFLRHISREIQKPIRGISVRALRVLLEYPWPGNVRELVHEVRRLVYVCPPGEAIESSALAAHIRRWRPAGEGAGSGSARDPAEPEAPEPPAGAAASLKGWLQDRESLDLAALECAALETALERAGGNQVRAGNLLGISRMAVRRRMEKCRKLRSG